MGDMQCFSCSLADIVILGPPSMLFVALTALFSIWNTPKFKEEGRKAKDCDVILS